MILKRTSAPAVEPVSLAEAKEHLRVDISDDDDLIEGYITAAREYMEGATRRAFITQTWRLSLDAWPQSDEIQIPKPPLQSICSIVYYDADGISTTWDAANYIVDTDSEPGRVALAYGQFWPGVTLRPINAIQITYTAGYGDAASDVPQWVKQAIKLLIGHWYENRETVIVGAGIVSRQIELAIESLIWMDRVF